MVIYYGRNEKEAAVQGGAVLLDPLKSKNEEFCGGRHYSAERLSVKVSKIGLAVRVR